MNKWVKRFDAALKAFTELKSLTKQVPVSTWTPEYRTLAEKIHTMGRDCFHIGIVQDLNSEMTSGKSPIEVAYTAMGKMLASLVTCPLCGSRLPTHKLDCVYTQTYAEVEKERNS